MRHDDIYITGISSVLGRLDRVEDAVSRGDYAAEDAAEDDLTSVSVLSGAAPTQVAAQALRAARESSDPARDVGALFHTGIHFQGQDYWTPAAHVARLGLDEVGRGTRISTIEIRQASNGGLAALSIGALHAQHVVGGAVAVTAADVFTPPHFDRYRSDKGLVLGDGGAAVILDTIPGVAALRSTAFIGDPSLEPLYAGDAPRALPNSPDTHLDLRGRKTAYLADHALDDVVDKLTGAMEEVLSTALSDADTKLSDIDRFVFPNTGRGLGEWKFLEQYGIGEEHTCWTFGRTIGHVGAADQLLGLEHLITSGELGSGSRVALCSSGIGFNWGAAIIEII